MTSNADYEVGRHDDCTAAHNCGEHPAWPFTPMTDEEWQAFKDALNLDHLPPNDGKAP